MQLDYVIRSTSVQTLGWTVSITVLALLFSACAMMRLKRREFQRMRVQQAQQIQQLRMHLQPVAPVLHPGFNPVTLHSRPCTEQEKKLPCAICLEPLGNSVVTSGSCEHMFHRCCLGKWLMNDPYFSCPICRVPLDQSDVRISDSTENLLAFTTRRSYGPLQFSEDFEQNRYNLQ